MARHNFFAQLVVFTCALISVHAFQIFNSNSPSVIDISQSYDKRAMTAYSFKAPFYLVRGTIPFWKFDGDTVVTDDYVRLTPAEKSRKGAIWNTKLYVFDSWEVDMKLKIGSPTALGADGMAFWYVQDFYKDGPIFGAPDNWNGLAVVFDTFDNDEQGDNPYIGVLFNDRSWSYEQNGRTRDAKGQGEIGGCRCNYRNVETFIKIQYFQGIVQVQYKLGANADYILCAQGKVNLPAGYYFGLSAATGGLADNHDVFSFETSRLILRSGVEPNQFNPELPVAKDGVQTGTNTNFVRPTARDDSRFNNLKDRLSTLRTESQQPPPAQQEQPPAQQPPVQPPQQEQPPVQQPPQPPQQYQQPPVQQPPVQQPPVQQNQYQQPPVQQPPQQQYQQPPQQQTYQQNTADVTALITEIRNLKLQQDNLQASLNSLSVFVSEVKAGVDKVNSASGQQLNTAQLATKTDLQLINNNIQTLQSIVSELKIQSANSPSANTLDAVNRQLNSIAATLGELRSKVDNASRQQSNLEQNLKSKTEDLAGKIESSGSFGFWTFFVLFQVMFGVAFMWWKKFRDDQNKKLF